MLLNLSPLIETHGARSYRNNAKVGVDIVISFGRMFRLHDLVTFTTLLYAPPYLPIAPRNEYENGMTCHTLQTDAKHY